MLGCPIPPVGGIGNGVTPMAGFLVGGVIVFSIAGGVTVGGLAGVSVGVTTALFSLLFSLYLIQVYDVLELCQKRWHCKAVFMLVNSVAMVVSWLLARHRPSPSWPLLSTRKPGPRFHQTERFLFKNLCKGPPTWWGNLRPPPPHLRWFPIFYKF